MTGRMHTIEDFWQLHIGIELHLQLLLHPPIQPMLIRLLRKSNNQSKQETSQNKIRPSSRRNVNVGRNIKKQQQHQQQLVQGQPHNNQDQGRRKVSRRRCVLVSTQTQSLHCTITILKLKDLLFFTLRCRCCKEEGSS